MQQHRFHLLSRSAGTLALVVMAVLLTGCEKMNNWFHSQQTTLQPETDSTRVIQNVYAIVTWIDVGIFVVVFALLAFAVLKYRVRPGHTGDMPKQVHGNAVMEVVWTVIPAVILIFIAVPTWSGIFRAAQPPAEGAFSVQAIGHQWWWEFKYDDHGIVTANEMVIPVGQPVIVDTNSVDVIHSFWVPKLSGKIDSLPGKTNTLWFTPEKEGEYYGQCAEFCGTSHANMRFRVHVVSKEAFEAWVEQQKQPPVAETDDARAGQQLFLTKTCVACHTISGNPAALGVLGPNLTNLPSRATLGSGIIELTEDNLVRWLRETQTLKPGALMGSPRADGKGYQPIDMTDDEARQIAKYLLSPPGAAAAAMAPSSGGAMAGGEKTAEQLFQEKACFGCHVIPGVPGAVGTIGPNLTGLMSRPKMAAGLLDTNEANLRRWLANPKAVKADSLMVTPPLSDAEIDTIVAFLLKLN